MVKTRQTMPDAERGRTGGEEASAAQAIDTPLRKTLLLSPSAFVQVAGSPLSVKQCATQETRDFASRRRLEF